MNPKLSQLESRWKFAKGWCDEEEWVDKVELEGIVKVGTAERPECFDKIEMDGRTEDWRMWWKWRRSAHVGIHHGIIADI